MFDKYLEGAPLVFGRERVADAKTERTLSAGAGKEKREETKPDAAAFSWHRRRKRGRAG